MIDDRAQQISRILDCSGSLYHNLNPSRDRAWLTVDLTMPQLKTLMCVTHSNGAPSGQIARRLGVGLSTVTGIVDRLAEQDLVTRHEDAEDRRITRVLPTLRGRALVDELMQYRNELITRLLSELDETQLQVVETAFTYLANAAARLASAPREQEVVV